MPKGVLKDFRREVQFHRYDELSPVYPYLPLLAIYSSPHLYSLSSRGSAFVFSLVSFLSISGFLLLPLHWVNYVSRIFLPGMTLYIVSASVFISRDAERIFTLKVCLEKASRVKAEDQADIMFWPLFAAFEL